MAFLDVGYRHRHRHTTMSIIRSWPLLLLVAALLTQKMHAVEVQACIAMCEATLSTTGQAACGHGCTLRSASPADWDLDACTWQCAVDVSLLQVSSCIHGCTYSDEPGSILSEEATTQSRAPITTAAAQATITTTTTTTTTATARAVVRCPKSDNDWGRLSSWNLRALYVYPSSLRLL